jgi:hypothetical protein
VGTNTDRRGTERLAVEPGFTPVRVRTRDPVGLVRDGHTYDLSESGVQFELDEKIEPGTHVIIEIELPSPVAGSDDLVERIVGVEADVVWADESEPGPVRMAARFTRFESRADRERLLRAISRGVPRRAA